MLLRLKFRTLLHRVELNGFASEKFLPHVPKYICPALHSLTSMKIVRGEPHPLNLKDVKSNVGLELAVHD